MAKTAGIALREDVLEAAFQTFVDSFVNPSDPAVATNHKRMGVIGFSDDATLLLAPTNDRDAIKKAPATFPDASRRNTKFEIALPKIKSLMGPQGSGLNGSARKTLLLITDGVRWDRAGSSSQNGPMNLALCDSFKNSGINVAVIEVKYQDATGERSFDAYVGGMYASFSPALQACASPGYYFQATDSDAETLSDAFNKAADALKTHLALKK